ncbi:MAG: RdgB/HAM1 family non-canonical purine NTP pyrophosphatase [Alphaproteobacteria bacterium]|nr:RdgB/HAM1 family non-canonical purine NTP pyrophosphatase [Alphaproteobacteria bacterium]
MAKNLNQLEIVLATHNRGKIKEFDSALTPLGVKLLFVSDTRIDEVEETGASFIENAVLKAAAASRLTNKPALADDSGLIIPALNGHPGINSKRWAESCGGFTAAFTKLESLLKSVPDKSAYFECALALYGPEGLNKVFVGKIHGNLTFPPRGLNGFGYDSIFMPEGFTQTFGEMDAQQKQTISHRANAIEKLIKAYLQ